MTKSYVDRIAITIRLIHLPTMGCGIVMLMFLVFVGVGSLAHAEEQSVKISNSTDMIGKLVKNSDGKNLGKIKDLIINWRNDGYIEYAVLSFGGFFGLGDEYVAVPGEALTLSDNKEYFVLNTTEEHLKVVHGFVAHHFYDRSSVVAQRGGRSTAAPSVHMMNGDIGSDLNVSVARSFGMQRAMETEFHR